MKTWRRRLIGLAGALLAAALFLEGTTWAAYRWPQAWRGRLPGALERLLLRYHQEFVRGAPLQLVPECSEPDPELLYRLRPGTCRFATDEFDTTVRVSARHLREDAMVADPELLVLGDSFSLGWGVEHEAAYPALLARSLGLREVVAAGSSYGTVRELLLLRRLGLRGFPVVVVLQYCANDLRENRAFLAAGRHVPSPPESYTSWLRIAQRAYGKRVLPRARNWFALAWSDLVSAPAAEEAGAGGEEHARVLLRVLGAFAADLRGRPLVVFAEGLGTEDAAFVSGLERAVKPAGLGPLRALRATAGLGARERFQLDEHWSAAGHRAVAAEVERALKEWAHWPPRP